MANIRPNQLPAASSVNPAAAIIVDGGGPVQKATPLQVVDAGRPKASQVQAEAGADNETIMTPLRVKQAIDELGLTPGTLGQPNGATLVGYDRDVTGSVPITMEQKASQTLHAREFGVSAAASASVNRNGLQAAIDYLLANSIDRLMLPAGQIDLDGDIVIGAHSQTGGNYLASVTIEGEGMGVNGSFLRFTTGSLIVNAPCHSLRNFRVTSLDGDGIHVLPGGSPVRYPARSEIVNVRAEYCAGSGFVIEDNWLYLMSNCYARQNNNWGVEGRNGPLTGLACNSWTLVGGEIQGNGTGTGSAKSTGGGVYTGRSVQMNLLGVSIEGNYSDGLVIGEQTRGLLISGCYFEKNGSHEDDRDIRTNRETVPYSATNAPNSVIIQNSNFTPQAANGNSSTRAIELEDVIDARIINPQFYALSGPILYAEEPIRIYESANNRSTGWVEGGWYSSALYTQGFVKNDCYRYGFPRKHVFSIGSVELTKGSGDTSTPEYTVPTTASTGYRVDANFLTYPNNATGVGRITRTLRRGPAGTQFSSPAVDVNYASSINRVKTLSNSAAPEVPGGFVSVQLTRNESHANDTLAASLFVQSVEVTVYEGRIAAN